MTSQRTKVVFSFLWTKNFPRLEANFPQQIFFHKEGGLERGCQISLGWTAKTSLKLQKIGNILMLPLKDFSSLIALLSDEDKPFEILIGQFQRLFPKAEQFKVCCCIYFLLKDSLLSKITSRMVALYILYEIYKNDKDNLGIAANPFFPIFLDVLQNPHSETLEKNFVIQLIGSQPPKEARN
jgi:hypothetical protein